MPEESNIDYMRQFQQSGTDLDRIMSSQQNGTELDNIMQSPSNGTSPETTSEFYAESFGEVLVKSIGYFAVCEFLIGTNGLVEKSGQIYAAGVNFITLKEPDVEQFTICDIYSLKFATIYNSRVRPAHLVNRNNNTRRGNTR